MNEIPASLRHWLSVTPPFQGLSTKSRQLLLEASELRHFRRKEVILEAGSRPQSFFILIHGRVKMTRPLESGRSALLALFEPGQMFGVAATLGQRHCRASMVALQPSSCLEVSGQVVPSLVTRDPGAAEELLSLLMEPMMECGNCLLELTPYRVEARFAQVLLKLGRETGRRDGGELVVPVRLTRRELASMTGTTIETTSRIMSRWRRQGLVLTEPGGFRLRDTHALESIARG